MIQIHVALTPGDTPAEVLSRPWTIQGWRPFSVRNHPAVFMRKGATTAQVATARKARERSNRCLHTAHAPHRANKQDQGGDVRHDPHRPVLKKNIPDVVASSVLLLVHGVDLVEALDLAVPAVGGQQREQVDLENLGRGLVVIPAADLEQRTRARLAGVPLGFGRSR